MRSIHTNFPFPVWEGIKGRGLLNLSPSIPLVLKGLGNTLLAFGVISFWIDLSHLSFILSRQGRENYWVCKLDRIDIALVVIVFCEHQ
jgi:hypothetical protein